VRDVSNVFEFAIENPGKVVGEVFNFGLTSANISKEELCEKIKFQIPEFIYTEAPLSKDPDQRNYIVSNQKIEVLGAGAKIEISQGITELIKGLKMFVQYPFSNL
jgi:nucleoside-diphosphate-sugar epimerase